MRSGEGYKYMFAFCAAILAACNPAVQDYNQKSGFSHPGMIEIKAAGATFAQGWNDTLATLEEKPGMRTSFTYDYWIDSTEITQGRFFDYTGRRPVADTSPYGVGNDYPVYNVTWFDAALFCNARSRAENLDTVYIYFGKSSLPDGRVYELTGLRCDVPRDGYRLPTEAEWEFAAREASSALPFSNPADGTDANGAAWYAANASEKTHPVASKRPNALGLYDMAGNVFEWTNDWKGEYNGKPIANSLGAGQPNGEYVKVIKGGGYNYGFVYLRPSRRSATYASALSSANEHVGFRCARGPISGGRYIGAELAGVTPNPVDIIASGATLRAYTGASYLKTIFVNVSGENRTLCCIDFAATAPLVREYRDDTDVYMPTISPDGRFAAYCSNNEGQTGPSKISVRSLDSLETPLVRLPCDAAYIPRWWIDPSTGDTCLVYTNSAVDNKNPLWKSAKTYSQKISGGKPVGSPREMVSNGGYHDGVSADGRFMASGYTSLMARNRVTNEEKRLFLSPANGKDAAGSTQVCNVSMSPDTGSALRCMFLDFGYPGISTVTETSYGVHQYLFISSLSDTITGFFPCPAGEQSWDYPEWSNQGRFAVAICRNGADRAHALYVIDVEGRTYLPIVEGTELQQPYLWIKDLVKLPQNWADSLGAYNDPPVHATQARFASRMHFFWQLCDSIRYAFVGSSHASCSIDPHAFRQRKVHSLAYSQCDPAATRAIIRNYVLPHCRNIKFIGMDFITGFLNGPNGCDFKFSSSIRSSKGYVFDSIRYFWKAGLQNVRELLINRPYTVITALDSLNLEWTPSNGWGGDNPSMDGDWSWDAKSGNYEVNMTLWEQLIAELTGLRIHVLFFISPESPAFTKLGFSGRYGPSLEVGKQIVERIKQLEKKYPLFHFYDAHNFGAHDYTDAHASDPDHLCETGARILSSRLDSLISTFMGK